MADTKVVFIDLNGHVSDAGGDIEVTIPMEDWREWNDLQEKRDEWLAHWRQLAAEIVAGRKNKEEDDAINISIKAWMDWVHTTTTEGNNDG